MKKLYRPVLTVLMVIGAMGVSGCDRKEDAGVKTIASFKDLTPPPFSKVVSHNVTNGAIVIHTQRLKSDPGGNLLS